MKRKLGIISALLTLALLLSACGVTTTALSEDFDETELKALAQEIVTLFCDKQFAEITAHAEEALKPELSPEILEGAFNDLLSDAGTLLSLEDGGVAGQESKGLKYGTVVVTARFENQVIAFSIAFNANLEIAGFNMQIEK